MVQVLIVLLLLLLIKIILLKPIISLLIILLVFVIYFLFNKTMQLTTILTICMKMISCRNKTHRNNLVFALILPENAIYFIACKPYTYCMIDYYASAENKLHELQNKIFSYYCMQCIFI